MTSEFTNRKGAQLLRKNCHVIFPAAAGLLAASLFACTSATTGRENTQDYIADKLKPKNLVLSANDLVLTVNSALPPVTASFSGTVESCSASPALPGGLSLNPKTCALSGTPTVSQLATLHTISAKNEYGSAQASINLIVNSTLAFAQASYDSAIIAAITPITPTSLTPIVSCSISPSLPAGISLNNATCAISGATPAVTGPTTYTMTASDGVQTASTSVTLAFGKVVYSWATATDNGDGTVSYLLSSSTPPPGYTPGMTVIFQKCSLGQTWQAATNTCSGSPGTYSVAAANTACNAIGSGWNLQSQIYQAHLTLHCSDKTYPTSQNSGLTEIGNCGAGNYAAPSVNALFPANFSGQYWTREAAQSWGLVNCCFYGWNNVGNFIMDYSNSQITWSSSTGTAMRARCAK